MTEWKEIKPEFDRLVCRRGVSQVARSIPAGRTTVYTWVRGSREPTRVAQARIREILEETKR